MKLTILGAGTCVSQFPGIKNQYPPAFLLSWDGGKILFDCSEGVRFRLEQAHEEYTDITHIALSHPHPDHCALVHYIQSVYVKGMWDEEKFKRKSLQIYCPDFIAEHFPDLWNFHLPELQGSHYKWPELIFWGMSKPTNSRQEIGNAVLEARPVYHGFGKVDALAYRIETPEGIFAYSGDTGISPGLLEVAKGADIFVCEASSRIGNEKNATEYGHLNPRQAAEVAKEAGVKKLILFHYSGLDSDEAMLAEVHRTNFSGEVVLGKDFDTFVI